MSNAATILRIADRLVSPRSTFSIENTGDLKLTVLIVALLYVCAISSMWAFKDKFGRPMHLVNRLTIEFIPPPPPPPLPKPIEPDKIASQTKVMAAVNSSIGLRSIDRPAPNPPMKAQPTKPQSTTKSNSKIATAMAPQVVTHQLQGVGDKQEPKVTNPSTIAVQEKSNELATTAKTPNTNPSAQGGDQQDKPGGEIGLTNQPGGGGGNGDGHGAAGQQLAMAAPHIANVGVAMGNIAPYRKDMLVRLAAQWHPKKRKSGNIVLVITLSHEGKLLNSEILSGSGDDKLDEYALETVGKTEFAPLPDWYRGSQLRLKVELARVEAMKSDI